MINGFYWALADRSSTFYMDDDESPLSLTGKSGFESLVFRVLNQQTCFSSSLNISILHERKVRCDLMLSAPSCFSCPDVVWPYVMPPGCQRSGWLSFRPELRPHQGGPLLCEALPRPRGVLALQPSPTSHQMPPQLQLPGQQLRQHHLHLQQGDHASSELPRHQGGRDWIKGFWGRFSRRSPATTLKWMGAVNCERSGFQTCSTSPPGQRDF